MSTSVQTQEKQRKGKTTKGETPQLLVRGGVALIVGSAAVVLAKALLGGSLSLFNSDQYDGLHSLVSYSSRMIAGTMM